MIPQVVFRVVTWIIIVIIGAVPALCQRCAKTPPVNIWCHLDDPQGTMHRPWDAVWVYGTVAVILVVLVVVSGL